MREHTGPQNKICCAKETDANERRSGDTSRDRSESGFDRIIFLQQSAGNQAIQKLFETGVLQAKLRIGEANDIYEREADRVAAQVMRMPDTEISGQHSAVGKGDKSAIQLKPG